MSSLGINRSRVGAKGMESESCEECDGWAVNSGGGKGGSLSTREDVERRTGVAGPGGSGESGDGVRGSGESESGAFSRDVVRDMRAEEGMEEESEMSGGCREGRAEG
jgi:hypothetical protein